MNVQANYKEVEKGFRIEINGTLMWETKTVEAAEGLTKLLNEKLADAYLEGHDDSQHGVMNVETFDDTFSDSDLEGGDDNELNTYDSDLDDIDEREFDV
jgi:hypothetical protein